MNQLANYVIYDASTGKVLGTHSRIDASTGEPMPMSDAEVLASCGVALDEKARTAVKVLAVDAKLLRTRSNLRVHTKRNELVVCSHLEIIPSRTELRGDGEDAVDLEIRVVQPDGKPDEGYNGRIKVSTQRGRLSEPGGLVQARNGLAKISLRSAPETVDQVRIVARDVDGDLEPGQATLAFL